VVTENGVADQGNAQLHNGLLQCVCKKGATIFCLSKYLRVNLHQSNNKISHQTSNRSLHYHEILPSQPFYGPFSGTTRVSWCRREPLDFMVQGKINRGRHTDHPAGRLPIQTNQCPPPPSPYFLQAGCPSCCPTNSIKALKATSAFTPGRRR